VRRPFLAGIAASAALLLPAAAQAVTLVGTVNGDMTIGLTLDGAPVTHLDPGPYTVEVHDNTTFHNFHLKGPGVDQFSQIGFAETVTWDVTFTDRTYDYFCDVHPTLMHGSFTVGDPAPPPPPPGAPARLSRVKVAKVNGVRFVTLTLQVARRSGARAQLLRRGRSLVSAHATFVPGRRTLKLRVPRGAKAGAATVKLTLTEAGRSFVVRRTVRLPS
jgi:hypothetical protein